MLRCRAEWVIAALTLTACVAAMGQVKSPASTTKSQKLHDRAAPLKDCFNQASRRYNVDVRLLKAIGMVESSFTPSAVNRNANGSEDMGIMQINTLWLPQLAKYGITRSTLMSDPCTNIHVGAWILAQNIQRLGPTWNAVGAYNASTPAKREKYVAKVWRHYVALHRADLAADAPAWLSSPQAAPENSRPTLRLI